MAVKRNHEFTRRQLESSGWRFRLLDWLKAEPLESAELLADIPMKKSDSSKATDQSSGTSEISAERDPSIG